VRPLPTIVAASESGLHEIAPPVGGHLTAESLVNCQLVDARTITLGRLLLFATCAAIVYIWTPATPTDAGGICTYSADRH
jgi:hypothetical protein